MSPLLFAGTAVGFFVLRFADRNLIAIVIALVTLLFAGLWFKGGARVVASTRSPGGRIRVAWRGHPRCSAGGDAFYRSQTCCRD